MPKIKEYVTDAFYTRWVLIPCFKEFETKDTSIREKKFSEKEMSGLLNKVLEALDRLEARGGFPEEWHDIEFVRNRWNMDINPVSMFIEECCEKGEFYEVNYGQFYEQLNKFREEKRARKISKTTMTKALKKLEIEKGDKGSRIEKENRYFFTGIQFKREFIGEHLELQKEEPISIKSFINGE